MAAITTPVVRISYPALFKPKSVNGGTPTYQITMMFSKTDPECKKFLARAQKEAEEVKKAKWPDPATAPRIPIVGHDKSPIKDGDTALNQQGVPYRETNPEYAGHWFIRSSSQQPIIVVDANKQEVLDQRLIYGGCYCRVNINPYAFSHPQNKGVTFGLNAVQYVRPGEAFGAGRQSVGEMFDDSLADGSNDPANYTEGGSGFDTPIENPFD